MDESKTRTEKIIDRAKNHQVISIIIVFFLFIIAVGTLTDSISKISRFSQKVWHHTFADRPKHQEKKLEPFGEKTFGILVAPFKGKSKKQIEKGKEIQFSINTTLNARFKELGISDSEAREISVTLSPFIKTHEEAREVGNKYLADLVIWGDITLAGIIPNLTIVDPCSKASLIIPPNMTILKGKLTHTAFMDISDIRLPSLTDEPTLLVSFITGLKYHHDLKYEEALSYFTSSLPEGSMKYVNSAPILFYIGNIHHFYFQDFDKAVFVYTKALEIDPNLAEAHANRGMLYRHAKFHWLNSS